MYKLNIEYNIEKNTDYEDFVVILNLNIGAFIFLT